MTYLLAISIVVNFATVAAFLKRDSRHDADRTRLLDRIQAPQAAADKATVPEPAEGPPYVAPDDDEGFWRAQTAEAEFWAAHGG